MKRFLIFLIAVLCGSAFGASVSFQSFNTNDFTTNGWLISAIGGSASNISGGTFSNVTLTGTSTIPTATTAITASNLAPNSTNGPPSYFLTDWNNAVLAIGKTGTDGLPGLFVGNGGAGTVSDLVFEAGTNGFVFVSPPHLASWNPALTWGRRLSSADHELFWRSGGFSSIVKQTGDRNQGAAAEFYGVHAGSASGMSDMPPRGPEIHASQPLPYIVLSSRQNDGVLNNLQVCTESNMLLTVTSLRTNNLLNVWTNRGIRVAYINENGWLTNHRTAGILTWNTNRFPSAQASPTNITYMLATNNIRHWLMTYGDTIQPTPGNTEVDLYPVSGISDYWHYPNGSNPFGANEVVPIITRDKIHDDVKTFYQWGIDGFVMQDYSAYYGAIGYQESLRRTFASASLYPKGVVSEDRTWRAYYPTNRDNALILSYLISDPHVAWTLSAQFEANGLCFGSNGHSTEPAGSGVLGETLGCIREHLPFWTNAEPKTTKLIMQSDPLCGQYEWDYYDWKNHLGFVVMFNANLWLLAPHYRYLSNSFFCTITTNANFLKYWQDPDQRRARCINMGATNGIFVKDFGSPINQRLLLLANMGTDVTTNLTVSAAQLGIPSNTVFGVASFWSNSVSLGTFVNSFTYTVGKTNAELFIITPQPYTPQTYDLQFNSAHNVSGTWSYGQSTLGLWDAARATTNTSFTWMGFHFPRGRGFTNVQISAAIEASAAAIDGAFVPVSFIVDSFTDAGIKSEVQTNTSILLTHSTITNLQVKMTFPNDTGLRQIGFLFYWGNGHTNSGEATPVFLNSLKVDELP